MKSHSPKRRLVYDWYKLNEETLSPLSYLTVFRAFEKDHPGVYVYSGFKGTLIDIRKGLMNFQSIPETKSPETKPVFSQPKPTFNKPGQDKFKVLIFSDCHGWLADLRALRCINKVLQKNHFDEVCINGDLTDLPYLSKHTMKLFQDGILSGYTEVGEIDYTRDQILKPLRHSTTAKIRVRIGNHDQRITKPNLLSDRQLQKLAILYKRFETTKFEEMLGLTPEDGYIYDPSDVYTYFDKFDVVHGLSLTKNAPEKNIQEYMSSGTSGHTHRLHAYPKTNKRAPYIWLESGHTRIGEEVEYFPTGKIPDWQQGFVCLTFVRRDGEWFFHWECIQIINGHCMYANEFYSG